MQKFFLLLSVLFSVPFHSFLLSFHSFCSLSTPFVLFLFLPNTQPKKNCPCSLNRYTTKIYIYQLKIIKYFSGTTRIESWKSNGMSEESIENITKSDSNFAPTFVDHHSLADMNFNGHCLIKNNISVPKKVINLYISYILGPQLRSLNTDFN